ncbi:MAG: hypothetical protein K6G90_11065 [Clostridia bacterium]|nr:hypothetical protein [Clostridia bacterium]
MNLLDKYLESPETEEIKVESLENMEATLPYEYTDSLEGLNGEGVMVAGRPPEAIAERLDYNQGDNPFRASGNCGLVSISNFLNLCGIETTENEVTEYAMEHNFCSNRFFAHRSDRGGTTTEMQMDILRHYDVQTKAELSIENGGTADAEFVAQKIEQGHAVMCGGNAGYLWNNANAVGPGAANHEITCVEAVRDPETFELKGIVICDSGRGLESDSKRLLTPEEFNTFINVEGGDVVYSTDPLRLNTI